MIVGIDLGTTYSEMARVEISGERKIIKNKDGDDTTPSVVHWKKNGEMIIGKRAKNFFIGFPNETVMEIKRKMGSSEKVKIYDKEWSPEEISALILAKLKKDAEEELKEKITSVVVTVPAYFKDGERKSTRAAAKLAGWKDDEIVIVNEPEAAAIEFGLEKKLKTGKIFIFDLGGGTFDVSVLNIEEGFFNVVATGGERYLGGKDFDKRIVDYITDEIKKEYEIDLNEEIYKNTKQTLVLAAEETKNALSNNISYDINLNFIIADKQVSFSKEISIDMFNELTKDLVQKTKDITIKTLNDAKIDREKLDKIVMVGGCSRIPAVRDAVKEIFPGKDILLHDPDLAIAKGAAIYARIVTAPITKLEDEIRKRTIDAVGFISRQVNHSLGIKAIVNGEHGIFSKIIKKGDPIPAKGTEIYFTSYDQQTSVTIQVYQGEERIAEKNKLCTEEEVTDIPPKPKGEEKIEVTFEYNSEELLLITIKILSTGKVIKADYGVNLSKESLAVMESRIKEVIGYVK